MRLVTIYTLCLVLFLAACGNDEPNNATTSEEVRSTEKVDLGTTDVVEDDMIMATDDAVAEVEEAKTNAIAETKEVEKTTAKPKLTAKSPTATTVANKPKTSEATVTVKKTSARPKISFDTKLKEFGHLAQGQEVHYSFSFTNTGDADLVIKSTSATCGCTRPTFPFIPIEPGKKGKIDVTFNSTGKLGHQKPKVTVVTNASPKVHYLELEGYVVPGSKEPVATPTPEKTTTLPPSVDTDVDKEIMDNSENMSKGGNIIEKTDSLKKE